MQIVIDRKQSDSKRIATLVQSAQMTDGYINLNGFAEHIRETSLRAINRKRLAKIRKPSQMTPQSLISWCA